MGFVEDERFLKYGARCLFFDRYGGFSKPPFDELNTSFNVGDAREDVERNLDAVKNISAADKVSIMNQIHSDIILEYSGKYHDADGMYTNQKGVFIGVRFADCTPIVLMDTKKRMIMSIHAGWRGTSLKISKKACEIFAKRGSSLYDIIVSIGPHICRNCYEIKEDVAKKFYSAEVIQTKDKLFLDLETANINQLIHSGINHRNIESFGICTFEHESFFSYRRDKVCGRNIGGALLS